MSVNIIEITKNYNTQKKCLDLLEGLRWGKTVKCPKCESKHVRESDSQKRRYICKDCNVRFSVFTDTIFEGTLLPLPKWFASIALVLNAKSGMAAKELERNIGFTYKTAYYTAMRIRVGMLVPQSQLSGIIEMDESYFGGKPRIVRSARPNEAVLSSVTTKRGRGTSKVSVAGMVQRKGEVRTKVLEKLTKRNLLALLKHNAKSENAILVTDGFKSYSDLENYIDRLQVNHSKEFSRGIVHINTIEGYWSFVKNGIRGSYKAISKKYLPFYLAEYEYKYNHRNFRGDLFNAFLKNALEHEKDLEYWKAESPSQVKQVAYDSRKIK